MTTLSVAKLDICIGSSLYQAGIDNEGRGFVGESFYLVATAQNGARHNHHARFKSVVVRGSLNRNEYAIQSGVKDFQRIINADNSDYVTVAELKQQHDNDMNFLRSALQTPCDIVVTHHVPFNFLVRPEFQNSVLQPAYIMECDELFHDYSVQYPEYWLFGHTHDKIVVDRGDVKFRCNPMGYTTEHGFSPIII
jgi:hypothetical protein